MNKNEVQKIRKDRSRVKTDNKDEWPRVRQRATISNGKRYQYWVVDAGILEGKRQIENFKTESEAQANAEKMRLERKQIGLDAIRLKEEDKHDAAKAVRLLNGLVTLEEAAKFYINHHTPSTLKKKVMDVYDEFMASKQHAGLSDMTVRGYMWKLGRFTRDFGDRALTSVTPGEIEAWMNSNSFHGQNRADYRRHLTIFYRFAISRKYAIDNMASAVSKVNVARKIPAVLTPAEVEQLLLSASRYHQGRMLPYFAIGCFCGLRPWELRKLAWADINFETKEIYISPDVAKTGQDRFVTMPDNLMEWLKSIPGVMKTGTLFYSRNSFNDIREKAELFDKWQIDVMRHSAASHLYAMTQNAAQVTAQMGHGLSVFMRHYRKTVSQREGEAYFRILPASED